MTTANVAHPAASLREFLEQMGERDLVSCLVPGKRGEGHLPCLRNAFLVLAYDEAWEGVLAFNAFVGAVVKLKPPPFPQGELGPWTDMDDLRAELWISQQYDMQMRTEQVAKAVQLAADQRTFHPVRAFLEQCAAQWDEKPRLDNWLMAYLGARCRALQGEDAACYLRSVAAKFLISAVARIFKPGCKADHVLILEGDQGIGKSSALKVLFGAEWFSDTPIRIGDKDSYQTMLGKFGIELAEMDSFNRADVEAAKAFFSSGEDHYRPSYGRRAVTVPRQCVFFGTANKDAYFKDESGNRRYWPVECTRADLYGPDPDDNLATMRQQLWGEAVHRFRAGEKWWPVRAEPFEDGNKVDEIALFTAEQEVRYIGDAYEELLAEYLDKLAPGTPDVTMRDLLQDGLQLDRSKWTRAEQTRVGIAMRRLGWRKVRGRQVYVQASGDR